jgi:hypothetical protein
MRTNRILLSLAMVAMILLAVSPAGAEKPLYPIGTVSIDLTSVSAGVGATWGSGVLRFEGREYPFKIQGINVGSVGITTINAVGNVYNLKTASDLAGTYAAVGAGIALAGGEGRTTMRNQKGVLVNLYAVQQGVRLNIGPEGFTITMQ